MYGKIALNIILIILLAVMQVSFISGLPLGLNNLNLILVVSVFILSLGNFNLAFYWIIGSGFLLDIFSFLPFGVHIVCLGATLMLANFLLDNFFTNRSLYSLFALIIFSTLGYALFLNIFYYANYLVTGAKLIIFNTNFWFSGLMGLGLNLLVALVLFYIFHFISGKLKPVF